jgi:HD-like signal output (HDOD) protein/DNA-binding NarL/FixJ family response regulator
MMGAKRNRILVVEDNDSLRQLLATTFERVGECEVLSAADGLDAVVIASSEKPDLILLDLRLPGIDGIEVCRRLKKHAVTRHIPILMYTAIGNKETVLAGLQAGASDYVIKGAIGNKELVQRAISLVERTRQAGPPPLSARKTTGIVQTTFPDAKPWPAVEPPPSAGTEPSRPAAAAPRPSPPLKHAPAPKLISRSELAERIARVSQLKAMPFAVRELMSLSINPEADLKEIVEAIERDSAITAQVLRLSNAAIYGAGQRISSVERAVAVIGLKSIRELAMGLAVIEAFKDDSGEFAREQILLSEHSFGCAVVARILAAKTQRTDPEKVFLGGLLHDVGKSMLFQLCGNEYMAVIRHTAESGLLLEDLEKQMLGIGHCEIAALVLNKWMMPPEISLPPWLHHQPWEMIRRKAPAQSAAIGCIVMGDRIAHACHFGFGGDDRAFEPEREMLEALDLPEIDVNAVYAEVCAQYHHLRTTMMMHSDAALIRKMTDPYDAVAQHGVCAAIVDSKPVAVNPVEFLLMNCGTRVKYIKTEDLRNQPPSEQDILILRARTDAVIRLMWEEIQESQCRPPACKVLALVNRGVDVSFIPPEAQIETLALPCRARALEDAIPTAHPAGHRS